MGPGYDENRNDLSQGQKYEFSERPFASISFKGLSSLLAVNHPGYAESVDHHAEADRPEGFLDRHLHRPIVCQCVKDAFRFCRVLDAERHGEASWLLIALGRSVGAHQDLVAHNHAGMNDFIAPFRSHLLRHGRLPVSHHCVDFAAKTLLIKLKRRLALAVEQKIRIQLHSALLWLVLD